MILKSKLNYEKKQKKIFWVFFSHPKLSESKFEISSPGKNWPLNQNSRLRIRILEASDSGRQRGFIAQ